MSLVTLILLSGFSAEKSVPRSESVLSVPASATLTVGRGPEGPPRGVWVAGRSVPGDGVPHRIPATGLWAPLRMGEGAVVWFQPRHDHHYEVVPTPCFDTVIRELGGARERPASLRVRVEGPSAVELHSTGEAGLRLEPNTITSVPVLDSALCPLIQQLIFVVPGGETWRDADRVCAVYLSTLGPETPLATCNTTRKTARVEAAPAQ